MTGEKKDIAGPVIIIKADPGYESLYANFDKEKDCFTGFEAEPIIAWQVEPHFDVDETHGRPRPYDEHWAGDYHDDAPDSTSTYLHPITVSGWDSSAIGSGEDARDIGYGGWLIKSPDGRILCPDEGTIVFKDEKECLDIFNKRLLERRDAAAKEEADRIAAGQKHTLEQVRGAFSQAKISWDDEGLKSLGISRHHPKHADYDRAYAYCVEKFKEAKRLREAKAEFQGA
jgi:hypothetical protein